MKAREKEWKREKKKKKLKWSLTWEKKSLPPDLSRRGENEGDIIPRDVNGGSSWAKKTRGVRLQFLERVGSRYWGERASMSGCWMDQNSLGCQRSLGITYSQRFLRRLLWKFDNNKKKCLYLRKGINKCIEDLIELLEGFIGLTILVISAKMIIFSFFFFLLLFNYLSRNAVSENREMMHFAIVYYKISLILINTINNTGQYQFCHLFVSVIEPSIDKLFLKKVFTKNVYIYFWNRYVCIDVTPHVKTKNRKWLSWNRKLKLRLKTANRSINLFLFL